jgi:hypothetical protein
MLVLLVQMAFYQQEHFFPCRVSVFDLEEDIGTFRLAAHGR